VMQAKDITDEDMLAAVRWYAEPHDPTQCRTCQNFGPPPAGEGHFWISHWTLGPDWFPDVPEKVVLAKLRKLLKRGLVAGCACGCRGDWRVVE